MNERMGEGREREEEKMIVREEDENDCMRWERRKMGRKRRG